MHNQEHPRKKVWSKRLWLCWWSWWSSDRRPVSCIAEFLFFFHVLNVSRHSHGSVSFREASIAERPTLVFDTKAIKGDEDDKETCPRSQSILSWILIISLLLIFIFTFFVIMYQEPRCDGSQVRWEGFPRWENAFKEAQLPQGQFEMRLELYIKAFERSNYQSA